MAASCLVTVVPVGFGAALPAAELAALIALAAVTLALIEGAHAGFTPLVLAAAVVFVAAVAGFVVIERRAPAPMLPLGLFNSSTFSGGNVVGLLINLGFYGELFVINLYFQQVLGYSALVAGLALLPQMSVVALGSALSGRFTAAPASPRPTNAHRPARRRCRAARADRRRRAHAIHPADRPVGRRRVRYVVLTMPAVTTAVVEASPADRGGLASGAINASRQVGGVIGVALLGALVSGGAFLPGCASPWSSRAPRSSAAPYSPSSRSTIAQSPPPAEAADPRY